MVLLILYFILLCLFHFVLRKFFNVPSYMLQNNLDTEEIRKSVCCRVSGNSDGAVVDSDQLNLSTLSEPGVEILYCS